MKRLLLVLSLLVSLPAFADESAILQRDVAARVTRGRHYILETEHVLRDSERNDYAARGIEIQRALPGNRYVVRATNELDLDGDPNVRTLVRFSATQKVHASALHAAATAQTAFVRVSVMFHDDVAYADGQQAIVAAGGAVERPLALRFEPLRRITARVPVTAVASLAADERVFGVFGPGPRMKNNNADAAALSQVNVIQQAPYGLTGKGVVLSLFELAAADASHVEFGGRVHIHFTGGAGEDVMHATHVAGTMGAAGLQPRAKGMAPEATIEGYHACDDCDWLTDKQQVVGKAGSVADNNSWGFTLGWWGDDPKAGGLWTWVGLDEYFGAYEILAATLDNIARCADDECTAPATTLFVHSAGNEADKNGPSSPPFPHRHVDDSGATIATETFCYSADGSGTDCPTTVCSTGTLHCERVHHPNNGPFTSVNFVAAGKNTVAVGAVDTSRGIGSFSSRGPTRDGRLKPDVVAKGINQYSTLPGNSYGFADGTSMSSPVVTGISGLLAQQWRKTFSNANPQPFVLKGLLIAGAEDLGTPGPDFTYGFGLVNAKNSADLIINDQAQGKRIRINQVSQGSSIELPLAVPVKQNLRVVLTWFDPEVPIVDPDEIATNVLLNDLDVKVIGPDGTTTMPYMLNAATPTAAATRGRNALDNTEEVEIANAAPGNYRVVVTGTKISSGSTQQYAVLANAELGATVVLCSDSFEPNDTEATAYTYLSANQTIAAKTCSATDFDFFKVKVDRSGPVSVSVTATNTPLRVTLSGGPSGDQVVDVPVGQTRSVATTAGSGSGTGQLISPAAIFTVKVQSNGTIGDNPSYLLTPSYVYVIPVRRRSTAH
jgi:hypothetical protein